MRRSQVEIRLDLSIKCSDEAVTEQLRAVLLPDNRGFPRGQKFTMSVEGSTLKFSIRSPRMMPGLSTLESILLDVNLFNEISQAAIGLTTKSDKGNRSDARRQAAQG